MNGTHYYVYPINTLTWLPVSELPYYHVISKISTNLSQYSTELVTVDDNYIGLSCSPQKRKKKS